MGNPANGGFIKLLKNFNIVFKFLAYCLYFAIVGLIIYAIYYCIFKAYPHISLPGHTESGFDDFMESYFSDMVKYIQTTNLTSAKIFLDKYIELFNDNALEYNQDLKSEDHDFSLNGSLPLHMYFMFYNDVKSQNKDSFSQCHDILYKRLTGPSRNYIDSLYPENNFVEMNDDAWNKFVELHALFETMKSNIRAKAAEIYAKNTTTANDHSSISTLVLDVMLSKYFDGSTLSTTSHDTILRMYQMRQTGGFSNFRLVKIYIGDYWDYAIDQKIKRDIWGQFPEQMKTLADRTLNAISSQEVLDWFTSLPSKLAGTSNENFKNKYPEIAKAVNEAFTISPYDKDTKEPFVDQLIKIAKTFVALFEVITSIINVISDPVAFIKFLIGTIIAIVLYTIYFILVNIQIAVAIAYIWAISAAIMGTVYWGVQVLIFAAFYAVLSVIDMPLGGFIMRSLRCENLPDAWSKVSNWHNGNMYERTFLCSYQCRQGFFPSDSLPLCVSQPVDEPVFAPHQVIYNAFKYEDYLSSVSGTKIVYSHDVNTDVDYLTSKPDTQTRVWKTVYDARAAYVKQCRKGTYSNNAYSDYDPLVKHMCLYLTNQLEPNETIKGLCENLYCQDDDADKISFCKTKIDTEIASNDAPSKDLVRVILFTTICIIVMFLALYIILTKEANGNTSLIQAAIDLI